MKLSELKATVAAMFNKETAEIPTVLFLNAANNARRRAELLHDFEGSRITADVSIVGAAGGALTAATNIVGAGTGGVKSITAISRIDADGYPWPVPFVRYDMALERTRAEGRSDPEYWFDERYPRDGAQGDGYPAVVQVGGKLFLYPKGDATIAVSFVGFGWLPVYVEGTLETADPDFIVAYGHEYLQWAIVVELNHIYKHFVPRQEGNVAPPDKLRDDALRNLILWDSYSVDSNISLV